MDAVPGMPTYFVFTPTITTEQYRKNLGELDKDGNPLYPEWHELSDPTDPESAPRWKAFDYELACAELCGSGHFSMRRVVRIVSMEEYKAWLENQQSYYLSSIRGSDSDPFKDQLLDFEISERKQEFDDALEQALSAVEQNAKTIQFNYVNFEEGSADLTSLSKYELDNLVEALNKYDNMTLELAGHTDNTGDPDSNMALSDDRATAVYNYLTSKGISDNRLTHLGYGQTRPVDTNDTDAGREKNRRTEFKILTQ